MKKIIIILTIFFFDRITKIYLINLQTEGTNIDFYIYSFLNFYLVWNTGIRIWFSFYGGKCLLSYSYFNNSHC